MGAARESRQIPPYISYRSFNNFLDELKSRGIPSRIDRSVMSHKSGTIQSQLLLALGYLRLVTTSGQPTQHLKELLEFGGEERKSVLREILKRSYAFVFDSRFGLETATSHQAEELFQRTGASGETVRRCIAFFLAAAKETGVPVSPYIQPHGRKKAAPRKRERSAEEIEPVIKTPLHPSDERVDAKEVHLKSGGILKLELYLNVFDLDERDREFVFRLIDQLQEYEKDGLGSS